MRIRCSNSRPLGLFLLCAALGGPTAAWSAAPRVNGVEDADRTIAPHFVLERAGASAADKLPLKASRAEIRIAGVIAEVTITQVWENRGEVPLNATYVFPASTRAAVHDLRMKIGERTLRAEILERQRAREEFDDAVDEGKTATLLEQHRPNVFQIAVGNIQPDDRIEVALTYTELVVPTGGVYELVYPQVVGPRYDGGDPDASRWADNPLLVDGAGEESGATFDWSIDVELSAPMPVASIGSPTHGITPRFASRKEASVSVAAQRGQVGADRDFVLRYRLQDDKIQAGVMLYRSPRSEENFFLLMMEPPEEIGREMIPPRELVFVIDVSGSMSGFPTAVALKLMEDLLADLRPQDRFNLLLFSGESRVLSDESLPPTAENIERALTFQRVGYMGGGTELRSALERALALPTDSSTTSRSLVVVTDGYITAERKVFELIRSSRHEANVFPFGIGSSVNRHLIEGLARAGSAEPFVVTDGPQAHEQAARFAQLVARPTLTDIEVKFSGLDAYDVAPAPLPDLMAERPLILFGKYRGPTRGRVTITGRTGEGRFCRTLRIEDRDELKIRPGRHAPLRSLWARKRVEEVNDTLADDEERKEQILALGLRYRLVTERTSFVAVDERVRLARPGSAEEVQQPSPTPAGVDPTIREGGRVRDRKKTTIDFSNVYMLGELTKPEGSYVKNRKELKFRNTIPIRDSFADKMAEGYGAYGKVSGRGQGSVAYGAGGLSLRGSGSGGGGGKARGVRANIARLQTGGGENAMRSASRQVKGRALASAAQVRGALDPGAIKRAIRRRLTAFQYCYQNALAHDGDLEGKLVLSFTINSRGRVSSTEVKDDELESKKLNRCLTSVLRRLRFPRSAGEATVTYRFIFKKEE